MPSKAFLYTDAISGIRQEECCIFPGGVDTLHL